jgi:hypothetical protein
MKRVLKSKAMSKAMSRSEAVRVGIVVEYSVLPEAER